MLHTNKRALQSAQTLFIIHTSVIQNLQSYLKSYFNISYIYTDTHA